MEELCDVYSNLGYPGAETGWVARSHVGAEEWRAKIMDARRILEQEERERSEHEKSEYGRENNDNV